MEGIECPECGSLDLDALDLLDGEGIVCLMCNNCEHEFEEQL